MMISLRDRSLLACVVLVLQSTAASAAVLELKLVDSIPAGGSNEVKLKTVGVGTADPGTDVSRFVSRAQTGNGRYSLVLTRIDNIPGQLFFTYEFIAWENGRADDKTQILVNVTATGRFPNFTKEIPFEIYAGVKEVGEGTIQLPLHPLDPLDVCKVVDGIVPVPTAASPLPVFLGGETTHVVAVSCADAAFPPRILRIEPPAGKSEYWSALTFQSRHYAATGQPSEPVMNKQFDLLTVSFTPNVLTALGARFRRFSLADRPDDTIVLNVAYAIQNGGLSTPLRVVIPVSFFPSLTVTAGSLLFGVLLGWLVSWLLVLGTNSSKPVKVARALVLGPALAVVAFGISVLAYGAKCRLEVFGLDVNPFDVLVLFAMGLVCGGVAVLKADELLAFVNRTLKKIKPGTAAIVIVIIVAPPLSPPASAANFSLIGLASCADGDILGLDRDGTVIHFRGGTPPGVWRRAGKIANYVTPVELTCAMVDGKRTAFVVAMALQSIRLIRMDVTSGRWAAATPIDGSAAGIAFDPRADAVFVTSTKDRSVYRFSAATLGSRTQWTSVFGATTIGAMTVDTAGNRLIVGEGYAGTIYALDLASRRQEVLVKDLGSANSLDVDPRRRLLYVADAYRRTVWSVALGGGGQKAQRFYRDERLSTISGVAVDGQSNVWISLRDRVLIVSPSGRFLRHLD